jgi:hypothetical protein
VPGNCDVAFTNVEVNAMKTNTIKPPPPVRPAHSAVEWGDAPIDTLDFLGRVSELNTLTSWIVRDRARLVAILGLGGIGKTKLAARVTREVAPGFERVYWRSLRNAAPFLEWSGAAIGFISNQQR